MNKRDKFKLDLISMIDDSILDKVSKARAQRYQKNVISQIHVWNARRISALAAAVFLLCFGAFLAIHLFGKQVPIYRGMTVSSVPPTLSASVELQMKRSQTML